MKVVQGCVLVAVHAEQFQKKLFSNVSLMWRPWKAIQHLSVHASVRWVCVGCACALGVRVHACAHAVCKNISSFETWAYMVWYGMVWYGMVDVCDGYMLAAALVATSARVRAP